MSHAVKGRFLNISFSWSTVFLPLESLFAKLQHKRVDCYCPPVCSSFIIREECVWCIVGGATRRFLWKG